MRVRVSVPPTAPPWERTVAGQTWAIGELDYDLDPALVVALEANMRSAQSSRIVRVQRLDAADLVSVRVTCPDRTALSGHRTRLADGGVGWLTHDGVWSAGVHWPTGTTTTALPPELVAALEAEIAAGHSILTVSRLDGAGQVLSTTAPTQATLQALT